MVGCHADIDSEREKESVCVKGGGRGVWGREGRWRGGRGPGRACRQTVSHQLSCASDTYAPSQCFVVTRRGRRCRRQRRRGRGCCRCHVPSQGRHRRRCCRLAEHFAHGVSSTRPDTQIVTRIVGARSLRHVSGSQIRSSFKVKLKRLFSRKGVQNRCSNNQR